MFDTEFIYKAQRKKMNIQAVQSHIRDGLTVSDMGFKVLKREMVNFFSILLSNDTTQF